MKHLNVRYKDRHFGEEETRLSNFLRRALLDQSKFDNVDTFFAKVESSLDSLLLLVEMLTAKNILSLEDVKELAGYQGNSIIEIKESEW